MPCYAPGVAVAVTASASTQSVRFPWWCRTSATTPASQGAKRWGLRPQQMGRPVVTSSCTSTRHMTRCCTCTCGKITRRKTARKGLRSMVVRGPRGTRGGLLIERVGEGVAWQGGWVTGNARDGRELWRICAVEDSWKGIFQLTGRSCIGRYCSVHMGLVPRHFVCFRVFMPTIVSMLSDKFLLFAHFRIFACCSQLHRGRHLFPALSFSTEGYHRCP